VVVCAAVVTTTTKQEAEHNLARVSYSCAVCPPDLTHVYAASSSDNCLRQLELPSMALKNTIPLDNCQASSS
jgi:peptide methionine sulfoxide reductase MsrB